MNHLLKLTLTKTHIYLATFRKLLVFDTSYKEVSSRHLSYPAVSILENDGCVYVAHARDFVSLLTNKGIETIDWRFPVAFENSKRFSFGNATIFDGSAFDESRYMILTKDGIKIIQYFEECLGTKVTIKENTFLSSKKTRNWTIYSNFSQVSFVNRRDDI